MYAAYATRLVPTMKSGYALVQKWNALPPQQRAEVQDQGRRTVAALVSIKAAITVERTATPPPESWDAALALVAQPGAAEEMAKAVVAHLQTVAEATPEEIASAVGAAGKDDTTLKRAMGMAKDDGYIHKVGITFRGIKWDTTEWADGRLLDSPHIKKLEEDVVSFVGAFGIVSLAQLCGDLGLDDEAPELRSALERAITDESVTWYCNGIYGLSVTSLDGFAARRDLWAETGQTIEHKDFGDAVGELEAAVRSLAGALKTDPALPNDFR
jgi:hypothetical protein